MPRTIVTPRHLDWAGTVEFIRACRGPLLYGERYTDLHVDMSRLIDTTPTGLAVLAGTMLHLKRTRAFARGAYVQPRLDSTRNFLRKMHFLDVIADPEESTRLPLSEAGERGGLAYVGREEDCTQMALALREFIASKAQLSVPALEALWYCLNELTENVFRHANSPINAVVCAQALPDDCIEIAIVDTGIGLSASFQGTMYASRTRDDQAAIRVALRPRVTSKASRQAGTGLFYTRKMALAADGAILVYSGDALLELRRTGKTERPAPYWHGTIVSVRLSRRMPVTLAEVFSRYAPDSDDSMEMRF